MATYLELKAQAEALMQQAENLRKQEIADVVAEIKQKMAQYGISAADLGFSGGSAKRAGRRAGSSATSVVRYKSPNGDTWSGMGRQPAWMKEALAQGKNKEDFAV